MNKARRESITAFQTSMGSEKATLEEMRDKIEEGEDPKAIFAEAQVGLLSDELEALRDEEQEYYDNMPEGLQNSEKGETAQGNVEQMEEAIEKVTEAREAFEALPGDLARDDIITSLNEIIDALDEADNSLGDAQN